MHSPAGAIAISVKVVHPICEPICAPALMEAKQEKRATERAPFRSASTAEIPVVIRVRPFEGPDASGIFFLVIFDLMPQTTIAPTSPNQGSRRRIVCAPP